MSDSLQVLEEILTEKIDILEQIISCNERLQLIISNDEDIDDYFADKDILLRKLDDIEKSYDAVMSQVTELFSNKQVPDTASTQNIQALNDRLIELVQTVQRQENENKAFLEAYFVKKNKEIGEGRKAASAALSYHQTQMGSAVAGASFMDSKK